MLSSCSQIGLEPKVVCSLSPRDEWRHAPARRRSYRDFEVAEHSDSGRANDLPGRDNSAAISASAQGDSGRDWWGHTIPTHDFGVVARMCDRVTVMYAGRIIEQADVLELFDNPKNPYTQALLDSVPDLDEDLEFLPSIEGQPPMLEDLPLGCAFAPRCPHVMDKCLEQYPIEFSVGQDHVSNCWRHDGADSDF